MKSQFEQLVRQVADESRACDAGLVISSETMEAYRKLLALYDSIVDPALKALLAKDRLPTQYCIAFIEDSVRTILMIRAINRAILARRKGGVRDLVLIEAGMGSGLLLGAALALDAEMNCVGYDKMRGNYEVTQRLIRELAYSTRAQLHCLDLFKRPSFLQPHVLIAEHINQGLTAEHATKIPRLFDIDPDYVVPYAVIPGVYWSGLNRTDRGEKIVLADRSASNHFSVKSSLRLPPRVVEPIAVCCDVEWGSSRLGQTSLLQPSSNRLKENGWENHLIQAVFLPADSLNGDEILAVENQSIRAKTASYQVHYPIGALANKEPIRPVLQVSGADVVSTTVFRGRAQLTASLRSVRRHWWGAFA